MKQIYLLLFSILLFGKNVISQGVQIRLSCGVSSSSGENLQFYLNEKPILSNRIKDVDVNLIETINIVKNRGAVKNETAEPAVFIFTKQKSSFRIVDSDSLGPIAFANLSVAYRNSPLETHFYQTDETGYVIIKNPIEVTSIQISAIGFQTENLNKQLAYGILDSIVLQRRVYENEEVVIAGGGQIKHCGICIGCGVMVNYSQVDSFLSKNTHPIKIFPNPVQRGGVINFSFEEKEISQMQVYLYSMEGRLLLKKQWDENNRKQFQLTIPTTISNGNYYLKIMDNKGMEIRTQPIVILP